MLLGQLYIRVYTGLYIRFLGPSCFFLWAIMMHAEKGGGVYLDLNAQIYTTCEPSELKLSNASLFCNIETCMQELNIII